MPGYESEAHRSADDFLFESHSARAAGRALSAAQLADIDLQLADGAAEGVAVHAQFASGAALVALIFLQHSENEAFLEFADTFGIKDVALVHHEDECFQLVFHE